MSKRLTVVYEIPDDYDVARITGTGELEVVSCVPFDALQRLAAAEAATDAAEALADKYSTDIVALTQRLASAKSLQDALSDESDKWVKELGEVRAKLAAAEALVLERWTNECQGGIDRIVQDHINDVSQRLAAAEAERDAAKGIQIEYLNRNVELREQLATAEAEHLTDVIVAEQLQREIEALEKQLATAESEIDALRSRCICELADDDDEASHECGWQVCGVCWNNAAAAHKKVADMLKAERAAARAAARWLLPLAGSLNAATAVERWPWLSQEDKS